jgi:hypothetical protein
LFLRYFTSRPFENVTQLGIGTVVSEELRHSFENAEITPTSSSTSPQDWPSKIPAMQMHTFIASQHRTCFPVMTMHNTSSSGVSQALDDSRRRRIIAPRNKRSPPTPTWIQESCHPSSASPRTYNGVKEHGIRSADMRAIQHPRIGAIPLRARVGEAQ